ncbi:type IV pilus secretin PilQ [Luteimonas notoginsengisoli]|uniref:Type IV pilus secretin PilQ n=1 Tax=Luteimonas notoginsengisoli TaxID=1578200 RepID=A0ABV7USK1_9GAMM
MTVTQAQHLQKSRRAMPLRASVVGLVAGLVSAFGAVHAEQPATSASYLAVAQAAAPAAADPAKQVAGGLAVSSIDFKRGDGGSGKLIMRFSGDGAMPDLRKQGSDVVINVGNASLSPALQRPLNVTDFATPVQRIDASQAGSGSQIVLSTNGPFESMAYQTGRDYIVEIVPRASAPARAVGAPQSAARSSSAADPLERKYTGKPVTFDFQNIAVRTVLKLIADESHLNIVASDSVQGDVTLRLDNVPWDQALDIVLQAKGLDKRRSGNVIWVAPQVEIAKYEQDKADARIAIEERAEMVTEYIPVNYGSAEDIAKLLTEESKNSMTGGGGSGGSGGNNGNQSRGFLSSRGSISFDRRTNTLLVIDIPERVSNIKSLVSELDRPVDQVVIEARIVIATESFARELGAKFGFNGATGKPGDRSSLGFGGNADVSGKNAVERGDAVMNGDSTFEAVRGMSVNLPSTLAGAGSFALSILNAGYLLDVELSALQTEGRGEVISNPRVVTSNQKEAVITQGREIGYITVTGGQSNNVPTVQFKEALLQLKVTPTITNDGRVFLNMFVTKNEQDGRIDLGDFGYVPTIARREVNTAVLVDDGQTVVIGGVYEFKDQNDVSKIPFLGDIPFLGNLFKRKTRSKEKAELLVFVTPKILRVAQRN